MSSCNHYIYKDGSNYKIGKNVGNTTFYIYTECTPTPTVTSTPTPSVCPDPLMRILMEDGSLIEAGNLVVGMKVLSYHEKTFEYGPYEIIYKEILQSKKLKINFTNNNSLICSNTHKIFYDNNWTESQNLKTGNIISNFTISSIDEYESGPIVLLTVKDAHTYICEGILSHNKSPPLTASPTPSPTKTPTPTPSASPAAGCGSCLWEVQGTPPLLNWQQIGGSCTGNCLCDPPSGAANQVGQTETTYCYDPGF